MARRGGKPPTIADIKARALEAQTQHATPGQVKQSALDVPFLLDELAELRFLVEQYEATRLEGSTVCPLCKRATGEKHQRGCKVGKRAKGVADAP